MKLTTTALALAAGMTIVNPAAAAAETSWCPKVTGHQIKCGTVNRPLVQGKPHLGTIEVGYALVTRRNRDQPAKSTILVNPGGPGGALIDAAGIFTQGLADALSDHDLLLVDPRGTGHSTPLKCGASIGALKVESKAELVRLVGRCGEKFGPRAEGYTSVATADDFDAVRARLGIDKVVLFGQSYGTYLMPIYAQRHPDTVQSIVLSGAYPIDFDSLGRSSAQAVSLNLHKVCRRSGACDGGEAVQDLAKVATRLRTAPVDIPVTVDGRRRTYRLTEDRLAMMIYGEFSGVEAAPGEVPALGRLPRMLHRAARGDDRELVALVKEATELAGSAEGPDAGLTAAVVCNDYPRTWPVDASLTERTRAFDRALKRTRPGEFGAFSARGFARAQFDGGDTCMNWPAKGTARPYVSTGRFPDVPVLVLSGDLDANTPDANGRKAAAQFRQGAFLSVPNTGHVPELEPSGCVFGIITGFIREEKVGDTSCVADIPPVKVLPVK
ncbi:alpha/beta fold hydrolase [Streptosporangium sp. NPDC003464]